MENKDLIFKDDNDNILLIEKPSNNCFLIIKDYSFTFDEEYVKANFKEFNMKQNVSLQVKISESNEDEMIAFINYGDIEIFKEDFIVLSFHSHSIVFKKLAYKYPDLIESFNKEVQEANSSIKSIQASLKKQNKTKNKTKTNKSAPKR